MRKLGFWEILTLGCIAVAAVITAADEALQHAPAVRSKIPEFIKGGLWSFIPLFLVLTAGIILVLKMRVTPITTLRLSYRQGVLYPDQLIRENISDFYSLKIHDSANPNIVYTTVLLMMFDNPVAAKQQIRVSFVGDRNPRYEITSFSFRYAIVSFTESLDGVTVDVSIR